MATPTIEFVPVLSVVKRHVDTVALVVVKRQVEPPGAHAPMDERILQPE